MTKACKKPKVFVSEGPFKELLRKDVKNLWKPYRPTPWLVFSHLQTMGGGKTQVLDFVISAPRPTHPVSGFQGGDVFFKLHAHQCCSLIRTFAGLDKI